MGNVFEEVNIKTTPRPVKKQYRKTAIVTASQFFKLGDHDAVVATDKSPTGFGINTLENTELKYEVTPGDYIIGPGEKGSFYACKPDIFAKTYEEVVPEQEPAK